MNGDCVAVVVDVEVGLTERPECSVRPSDQYDLTARTYIANVERVNGVLADIEVGVAREVSHIAD